MQLSTPQCSRPPHAAELAEEEFRKTIPKQPHLKRAELWETMAKSRPQLAQCVKAKLGWSPDVVGERMAAIHKTLSQRVHGQFQLSLDCVDIVVGVGPGCAGLDVLAGRGALSGRASAPAVRWLAQYSWLARVERRGRAWVWWSAGAWCAARSAAPDACLPSQVCVLSWFQPLVRPLLLLARPLPWPCTLVPRQPAPSPHVRALPMACRLAC